jgi:hypothetical protein
MREIAVLKTIVCLCMVAVSLYYTSINPQTTVFTLFTYARNLLSERAVYYGNPPDSAHLTPNLFETGPYHRQCVCFEPGCPPASTDRFPTNLYQSNHDR